MAVLMLSLGCERIVEDDKICIDRSKAGFTQIFNGRDLVGWDGEPNFWSVENGVIVARVRPSVQVKNHSYLIWQGGKLRDFELRLKLRSTQGNSGVDYRAEPVRKGRNGEECNWTIRGYQSDIAKGWMGSLYNWGKPGAQPSQFVVVSGKKTVTKEVGAVVDKDVLYKAGYYRSNDWNDFTIIARGSHILHRINGYPVAEFIDNSRDARREGLLGLQVHSGRGPFLNEFHDIRIKHFKISFGRAKSLFNAEDLTGWTFSSAEAKNAWTVGNGVLVCKPGPKGYICTNDSYTNYVLRFQYRRLGEDKGAVLLRLTDQYKSIRISGKGDDFSHVKGISRKLKIEIPETKFRKMPEGFWDECEIILNKGLLEVRANDVLQAVATGCEQNFGAIGFQAGASRVEYRNIVLIPILSDLTK
jgi:hypothetical protein